MTHTIRQLNMEIMQEKAKHSMYEKKIEEEKARTERQYHNFLNCEESLRKLKVESTERIRIIEVQMNSAVSSMKTFMKDLEDKKRSYADLESRYNIVLQERETLNEKCSSMLAEGNRLYVEHETLKQTYHVVVNNLRNEIDVLKSTDNFLLKTENENLQSKLCEQDAEIRKLRRSSEKNFNKTRYLRTLENLFLSSPGWEDIFKLWKRGSDGSYTPLTYAEYTIILKEKQISWKDTAFWSQYLSLSMLRALRNRTAIVDELQGSATVTGVTSLTLMSAGPSSCEGTTFFM